MVQTLRLLVALARVPSPFKEVICTLQTLVDDSQVSLEMELDPSFQFLEAQLALSTLRYVDCSLMEQQSKPEISVSL